MSLKEQFSLLTAAEQEKTLLSFHPEAIEQMARGEWWWESRPEQVPPPGDWLIHLFLGGRGCVAPWTMIYLPGYDEWVSIKELAEAGEPIQVLSQSVSGEIPAWTQGAPFLKGHADLWHVRLEDGRCITVTDQHRFLTQQGWRQLADVRAGQLLAGSTLAPGGEAWPCPYGCASNAPRSKRIGANSRSDYRMDHRSRDPLPHLVARTGQGAAPSQADAAAHSQFLSRKDVPASFPGCSRTCLPTGRQPKNGYESFGIWVPGAAIPVAPFSGEQPLGSIPPTAPFLGWKAADRANDAKLRHRSGFCGRPKDGHALQGYGACLSKGSPVFSDAAGLSHSSPRKVSLETPLFLQLDIAEKSPPLAVSSDAPYLNVTQWLRIAAIEHAGFGPFYDMTVPGTENYVSNGIVSHNTGKTRSGAEWLVERTLGHPYDTSGFPVERLVMAYNLSDARQVCIEGASGVLRVLNRLGYEEILGNRVVRDVKYRFHYTKSPKPHITILESEAKIYFTGADPDSARGYNLADVWLDEICKWPDASACWKEGIMPALRADLPHDKPRAFVTTTPKPINLLQEWVEEHRKGSVKISLARGSTFDNSLNLSQDFLEEVRKAYEGTALGRQELYGEMLDTLEGALFSYAAIESHRVDIGPEQVAHRAVGVDPGLTGAEDGDEMGVVVASRSHQDHIYVLADRTTRMAGRDAALYAWRIFEEFQADTLVYESNLGKAWMEQVFTDAYAELQRSGIFPLDTTPPLVAVFSNQGKKLRAEPVAMRYSQGRVHHIGKFEQLEKQMLSFDPITSKVSPDRLDALVHVCRHLMEGEKRRSRIISPLDFQIKA